MVRRRRLPDVANGVHLIRRLKDHRAGADAPRLAVNERFDRAFLDDNYSTVVF